MVLAKEQTSRSIEKNREPRSRTTEIQLSKFQYRNKDNALRKDTLFNKSSRMTKNPYANKTKQKTVQVQWLIPVIPPLWKAEVVDHEVKRSRPAWPTW